MMAIINVVIFRESQGKPKYCSNLLIILSNFFLLSGDANVIEKSAQCYYQL